MDANGKQRQSSVRECVRTDQDKIVISKIMQRFRPIAPKPAVGESSDDTKSCNFLGRNKRSKRKYVRAHEGRNNSSRSSRNDQVISTSCDKETDLDKELDGGNDRNDIVTLQLLPEKDGEYCSDLSDTDPNMSFYGSDPNMLSCLDRMVESWLTVECVSYTCTDLELGQMDHGDERMMRMLESDTCPCLISDESNQACWVNRAYRRMIGDPEAEMIRVWLVVTTDLMEEIESIVELYSAVTCRVSVRYSRCRRKETDQVKIMTVPCDVWRIRSAGGFAWRLDVESALRLGM